MGVEEVFANQWMCDHCNRMRLIHGDDQDPPLDWIVEEVLSFCCYSHQSDWHKKNDPRD